MTEVSKKFNLNEYIPCQLAALSHSITRSLALVFEDRFDISLPEWKVLATIAERPGQSAVAVAQLAQMDTVAVSRAVTKLLDRDLIQRELDSQDRRCSILNLSAEGLELYAKITPLASELEANLLGDLSDEMRLALKKAVATLHAKSNLLADEFSTPPRLAAAEQMVNRTSTANRYYLLHPATLVGNRLNRTTNSAR
jgi:DNA-binding MarR family transcriptional regulator